MKAFAFAAAFCLCASAFAQSSSERSQGALGDSANKQPSAPAAAGESRRDSNESFTHGESKRCANLSGDEKVLCDKEEATKAQGQSAEDLSKSGAPSPQPRR